MAKPFLLLEPGPAHRDEPHQRGDSNLLETNNLSTIAAHVLSGGLVPADYQSRVLCLTDWRRKGGEYDLAPLARQFPSSNRPDFEHISRASFDAAFALDPGGLKLTEAEKGDLQPTNLGGFGAPSAMAGGSGRSGGAGRTPAAGGTKIKLKVKAGKGEKRKREGSAQPG